MIYLLRHGQTEHNLERRIQGRCDSPLTQLGKAQACAIGEKLRELLDDDDGFELVSSPLARALASAEIVAESVPIRGPLIVDQRLVEVGCGSWEKHRFATLAERDPRIGEAPGFLAAWAQYCTDGETLDEAIARLSGWLAWAEGRKLVVISHGVAGSVLRALYLGLGRNEMLHMHSTQQGRFHLLHDGVVADLHS